MIRNLVALGNCLKSGSNRGTGTEWNCALVVLQVVARADSMIMYSTVRRVPLPLPVTRDF
jgi:hypothetical protein